MEGLTSVFHIFALVSLFALAWWVALTGQRYAFAKRLWKFRRAELVKEVWIDWPHRFLEQFCLLCNADFDLIQRSLKPCRILPRAWIDLDDSAQIIKVTFDARFVKIYVKKVPSADQLGRILKDLSEAFHGDFQIDIVSHVTMDRSGQN